MAQHLSQHHPNQVKNKDAFSFKVMATGERPLTRQLREAQKIANNIPSGQLINGRNEHIAPAFQQMAAQERLIFVCLFVCSFGSSLSRAINLQYYVSDLHSGLSTVSQLSLSSL